MAENFVQIRIKATDTAKPDLTSLKADLDELGHKVETAQIDADDSDAKRKLLEVNAELARLNKRVASSRIDVAGAAKVESDLEKVSEKFDELKEKADKAKDHAVEGLDSVREHVSKLHEMVSKIAEGGGLLSKLLYGAESVGEEGGGGAAGLLPGGGALVGLAVLVPAIEAAAVEITGLASGFAAAGAGAGAFALLAVPAFDKVKGALKDTHKELMKLNPDERGAVYGIRGLEDSLKRMSTAFEPQAFKVFNDGLKIANELLPAVKPFADTAASAFGGLLKQAAGFFKIRTPITDAARGLGLVGDSARTALTPFGQWLKQFHSLEGPSIHAIGEGIGRVAVQIGKLLTVMSKKDVVHAINIAFDILVDTIKTVIYIVSHLMKSWDQLSSAFRRVRHDIAADAHEIAHIFDDLRHNVADFAHNVAAHFDEVRHDVADLAHNIASHFDEIRANLHRWADDVGRDVTKVGDWFKALPGKIMGFLASLPGKLFAFGAHIISMLADGIKSAIGDVGSAMVSVGTEIWDHIPHSPAKKGPLSGSGDPRLGGLKIGRLLAEGLDDSRSIVSGAADRMAGGAVMGGHGGGGGRPIQLEVRVPRTAMILGSDFWTAFQNGIRAKGGDPRIVQMKVVFQ